MKDAARQVLRLLAVLGFVGSALAHLGTIGGFMQAVTSILAPLVLLMFALGCVAVAVCLHMAYVRGVVGRDQQWLHLLKRCPPWFKGAQWILFGYAILWFAVVLVGRLREPIVTEKTLFPAMLSAFLMVFYFSFVVVFHGGMQTDGSRHAV